MRGLFKSLIFAILACYLTSAQEISCAPPKIAHGTITDGKMEYSENDPIKYECDEGYRPRRGAPKCLKSGWSITPECEEKVCRLEFVRYRVESTTPIGKNIFRIGENVTITCSEKYFLHFTKLNPGTIKCLDSGEWETPPVCEESACPEPTVENARILSKSEPPYKPGARIEYQCLPGYEPERFTVTCDQDGRWQSMKSCTVRRVGCGRPPLIPHAVQDFKERYEEDEKATYDCPSYYVQDGDRHMVCKQGRWTGNGRCLKPCTVDVHVLDARKIELKIGGRRKIYSQHNDFITFVCAQGYTHTGEVELRQRCTDGVILLPTCV